MTTELHTNDEPQRILLEASERIKACYPSGTRIEVRLPLTARTHVGHVFYAGAGDFFFQADGSSYTHKFIPAIHPHRVLP